MFGNTKQSIPRLFLELMELDKSIRTNIRQNPIPFQNMKGLFEDRKRMRIAAQEFLRRLNTPKSYG